MLHCCTHTATVGVKGQRRVVIPNLAAKSEVWTSATAKQTDTQTNTQGLSKDYKIDDG